MMLITMKTDKFEGCGGIGSIKIVFCFDRETKWKSRFFRHILCPEIPHETFLNITALFLSRSDDVRPFKRK